MKIERWQRRQADFGLRRQHLSGWTTESSDRELQKTWDRRSSKVLRTLFTGAQLRAGSVGPVWRQARRLATAVKMAISCRALNSLKNDGPRGRPTRRRGEARGFRTVLGRVGARNRPARARCRGLLDGAGRRPMRHLGTRWGSKAPRLRCFRSMQAGSPGSVSRRLPRVLGEPTLRKMRSCASRLLEKHHPTAT